MHILFTVIFRPLFFRPLVPVICRRAVFDALHSQGHPGRRATKRLICSWFVWPHMAKQITQWATECLQCQRAKTHQHVSLQPTVLPVPTHVNIDLVGLLTPSCGFTHLLTIIDRASRWPEAILLPSTTATACAQAFFCRLDCPFRPTGRTDLRSRCPVHFLPLVCPLQHSPPSYAGIHPQANSLVEWLHHRLKGALRARCTGPDWCHHLP